jgi:hypothetical protein
MDSHTKTNIKIVKKTQLIKGELILFECNHP